MKPSALAGVGALVVGAITIGRSFNCDADEELLALSCLTGVLAAIWNDNAERGVGARIAKFLVLVFMVGMAVFFFTLMVYNSQCRGR